ncbi:39S ribosomal protein S30, mitochondrial [Leptidea sinapis]|uniref:39S ribosomal protein S30, mitochondrial n=1 Tax=Leptidea sinapis TaxID=189913 RepID=UPI0021387197|nr:39S ribosomal protein S30, mitochondrial [Leptidea sinapis]
MLASSGQRMIPKLKSFTIRRFTQPAISEQNEYTDVPNYPPILDTSLQGRKQRKRETLYENIKALKTVEEKQIALNMPRYYGWPCIMFKENSVPYNAMPFVQYYTKTYFKSIHKLPDTYNNTSTLTDTVLKDVKSHIEDCIAFENIGIERKIEICSDLRVEQQMEDLKTKEIVKQINRIIMNNITDKVPHILSTQVDYEPRHEAFWFMGGGAVPRKVINWRKQYPWLRKDRLNEAFDKPVQYIGSPMLTLRNNLPLRPIIPYNEAENPEFKVNEFEYVPESVGYVLEHRYGTNIPGFWPGDQDEFGLLSYHGRGHIINRKESFGAEDNLEALHCQAIKSSFGWLLAQANYQGFTTYNDITYPLTTQTVITNGQLLSFYVYQLNTITMNIDAVNTNPKHNICYGTKPMELYETIEDGKVKGLNEDTLKMLIQFYVNAPVERDHELKPYLGHEEQVVADIEEDERRNWLEATYKHIVSNRPKHVLMPEIYLWEKIYKIQHNTRFFEAKKRPFELGINPFKRRLDEHLPPYIPKVLRPYPKCRKKFETMYYPKI